MYKPKQYTFLLAELFLLCHILKRTESALCLNHVIHQELETIISTNLFQLVRSLYASTTFFLFLYSLPL